MFKTLMYIGLLRRYYTRSSITSYFFRRKANKFLYWYLASTLFFCISIKARSIMRLKIVIKIPNIYPGRKNTLNVF